MKNIFAILLTIVSLTTFISAEQFSRENLTIKGITKFSDGTPAILFNEVQSDLNWLNCFLFKSTMVSNDNLRKELIAMLIHAQSIGAKMDVSFERDGTSERAFIINFIIKN
jgi:hypothetical protein